MDWDQEVKILMKLEKGSTALYSLWLVSMLHWLMSGYMIFEDQIQVKYKVMISNVNYYGFADILT